MGKCFYNRREWLTTSVVTFFCLNLLSSFDLSVSCSHKPSDCFAPLFQKREPSGLSEKTPFLFCKAFFFVAIMPKKKASNKS